MNWFNLLCRLTLINTFLSVPIGTLSSLFSKLLCVYPVHAYGSECWHQIPAMCCEGTAILTPLTKGGEMDLAQHVFYESLKAKKRGILHFMMKRLDGCRVSVYARLAIKTA